MAVVIGGQGVGGGTVSTPITLGGGAGSGYTWSSATNKTSSGSIKLEGADADIFVQGKSMKAWMDAVEKRLLILEPKPELLKKYKALEQAYEHYKTLEAILYEQE
jgi:C-terminal processing protease CtpA/Prc